MSKITEQDRHDYEDGRNEASLPFLERTIHDVTRVGEHSDSFWKGRNEERLDGDKKDK
jgi:hypothetical protein